MPSLLIKILGTGVKSGYFWGLLIGILFLSPLLGAVLGAAGGALGGALSDIGVDDVKSSCPLHPGLHTYYNATDKGQQTRES